MALRDEIASLNAKVSDHRTAIQRDFRSMEHFVTIKQDVDDTKKFFHELRSHKEDNSLTFAGVVSGPVPSRSNESRHIPEGLSRVSNPTVEARDITCLRVKPLRTLYLSLPTF